MKSIGRPTKIKQQLPMIGPLQGIRVIDFGQHIAGPLAAVLLARQGAQVIHVDAPGGSPLEPPINAMLQAGKSNVTLDLKAASDLRLAQQLILSADVVIENFRPGAMDRLGIGAHAMTERSSRLVYCSIPGFPFDDPRAKVPAFEGVVAAAAGLLRPVGDDMGVATYAYRQITVASTFAAAYAAISIAAGLLAKERDGLGQIIEVPLLDVMREVAVEPTTNPSEAYPQTAAERGCATLWGQIGMSGGGSYRCADGRFIKFWPRNPKFMDWLLTAAGESGWDRLGLLDLTLLRRNPGHRRELRRRLGELFASRSAAAWEAVGMAAGIPLAMHRTTEEWLRTEQARAIGATSHITVPELGSVATLGQIIHMSSDDDAREQRPCRHLERGELVRLLRPSRRAPGPAPRHATSKPPLDGIVVIDTTQVLAGPTAGRILSDFGARVIKINSPLDVTPAFHLRVNRGKQSVLLDIFKSEGRRILHRLVRHADVFIENFARGVADRSGFGHAHLSRSHPSLIYCSISAYGHRGPWANARGYESTAQAVSGLDPTPSSGGNEITAPLYLTDLGCGLLAAFAITLALFARRSTGTGQHVQTSLAQAATLHSCIRMARRAPCTTGDRAGAHSPAVYRPFRCADECIFLVAFRRQLEKLGEVVGEEDLQALDAPELERSLARRLGTLPARTWIEKLQAAGFAAHRLESMANVLADPAAIGRGAVVSVDYRHGAVTTVAPAPRFSRTPLCNIRLPKAYGGDTRAVLAEFGRTAAETAVPPDVAAEMPLIGKIVERCTARPRARPDLISRCGLPDDAAGAVAETR
ncbi:MAG: CoA transferase [Hyphomicrobiales bacterium]|nr:CoA transferase [Hyphomicrobiales bacterium]